MDNFDLQDVRKLQAVLAAERRRVFDDEVLPVLRERRNKLDEFMWSRIRDGHTETAEKTADRIGVLAEAISDLERLRDAVPEKGDA